MLTKSWLYLLALLLLTACNLRVGTPPAPTAPTVPTLEAPTTAPSRTPVGLPTLLPTPAQSLPGQEFVQPIPVTVNAPGVNAPPGAPTLSAALADDRYEVTITSGGNIGLNYEAEILRGSLSLVFQGPDGIVWQQSLTVSDTQRIPLTIQQGGVYELLIFRQNFDGSYSFRWD